VNHAMNRLEFIRDFDPFKMRVDDFLLSVREEYDEHYGKWYQEVRDNDVDGRVIEVDIRTGGWSENEDVVNALLENTMTRILFYHSWQRGGQHVFHFYQPSK
jgi:hypothetical protein